MMKRKKGLLIGLGLLVMVAGCTDPEGYKAKIEELEAQVLSLESQNEQLALEMGELTITEETIDTSLQTVEGSNVPVFKKIAGSLILPNKLQIPGATDDINNSYMMVGSMYKFFPSNNWIAKMDGASLKLAHPSNIGGTIKAVGATTDIYEEDMKPIVQSFFTNYPKTTISYRKIFMDDYVVGMMASAPITVDGKENKVTVGFAKRGEYGVLFLFNYEDDGSGVQKELIDLLISSGMVGDSKLKLE